MRVNDRYVSFYSELDTERGEISFDPAKTALLVVDLQRFFVERPAGDNLSSEEKEQAERWKHFYDKIEDVVLPNNQKILKTFRGKKMEVLFAMIQSYTKDGRERSLDQKATGFNELLLPPGSRESEIMPQVAPIEDEIVIKKTTDSAVTGSSLRLMLHNIGIDTVVVTGVFTDQCVSSTVRSLADESFKVWLIEDATMAATEEIQNNELTILNNIYCHVINTDELLGVLG